MLLAGCAGTGPATPSATVYVAGQGMVRALDAATLTTRRTWAVTGRVAVLLADPASHAAVALTADADAGMWRLDPRRSQAEHRMLGVNPAAATLDPKAEVLYVAGTDAGGQGWLQARDGRSGELHWQRRLSAAAMAVCMGPEGTLLAASADGRVEAFDSAGKRGAAFFQLDAPARALAALPYGHTAFALTDARLALLDTARAGVLAYLPVGEDPRSMELKPDGGELYVSNAAGTVTIVNTSTGEVAGTLQAGLGAGAMAVTADGSLLFVANDRAGTLSATTLATRKPAAFLRLGTRPEALAQAPGGYLFAADAGSNDLAVVRLATDANHPYALMTLLPTVPAPNRLVVVPGSY